MITRTLGDPGLAISLAMSIRMDLSAVALKGQPSPSTIPSKASIGAPPTLRAKTFLNCGRRRRNQRPQAFDLERLSEQVTRFTNRVIADEARTPQVDIMPWATRRSSYLNKPVTTIRSDPYSSPEAICVHDKLIGFAVGSLVDNPEVSPPEPFNKHCDPIGGCRQIYVHAITSEPS